MQQFFDSGRIVDAIVLVMILEAIVLLAYRRATGRGLGFVDILSVLLPGACLLLALRAALRGEDWSAIALWLIAAFLLHLADIWRRVRASRPRER
jgi:hypothetical protein